MNKPSESFMQEVPRVAEFRSTRVKIKMDRDIPCLTEGEAFIYKWQERMLGSFKRALRTAIALADDKNIERLRVGFPVECEAWEMYKGKVPGWWDGVQAKVKDWETEAP